MFFLGFDPIAINKTHTHIRNTYQEKNEADQKTKHDEDLYIEIRRKQRSRFTT